MGTRAVRIIGRNRELELLGTGLANARQANGASFFMIGEPGIGKTRLAVEMVRAAKMSGATVLRGRGSSIGPTVPFRPFAEALMPLSRADDGVPSLAELGAYRPVLSKLIPDYGSPGQAPGDTSLLVLAEAVFRLVCVLGRAGGCLLVLEDLHDADAETLALVEYLADNLRGTSVMLLASSRNEPCDGLTLARTMALRQTAEVLELARLGLEEIRELAASCLDAVAGEVPAALAETLWNRSAGNPLMAEELLHTMVSNGQLTRGARGWRLAGDLRSEVPATYVRTVSERADRFGPDGRRALAAAAVLGRRFPLSVVRAVTDPDEHSLKDFVRAGIEAQLITSDEPAPDWYAFAHPLTAEALLSLLTPVERAELSRRAAEAVERIHPELPGEWCQLVASLRAEAGDTSGAANGFTEAGRRALADGATESAVSLLERALSLMSGHAAGAAHADLLDLLLQAYADSGKFDRAFALADRLREFPGLTAIQRAVLHIRAAAVYDLAGRWSDGVAELDLARVLLGSDPADEHVASLDAIASELALNAQIPERMVEAERLARRALAAAERSHQPAIACRAWLTMAVIARRRDIVEADSYLRRARALAEVHRLPGLRTYTQYLLGVHSWLADSSTAGLELAREDALRVGAVTVFCAADASLALNLLLRGEFAEGSRLITQQARTVHRLQMSGTYRYLMMAAATAAAHQGRRQAMEQALAEFHDSGGARSKEQALALGLAQAFCSLLEEDMDGAVEILTQLSKRDQDHPTSFSLDGRHGLQPFLDVLRGQLEPAELDEVRAAPGSTMRWNRQFVLLADAVLLGRAGRPEEAADRFAQAQQAAAIYPMARNLGLRLVTEHAYVDGWGDPREWLGAAEDYFHTAGISVVASACRALLRRFGLPVRQWRTGTHLVPPHLRVLGVTIRELEVLEMLVQHLPNKEIASRLHISPRTVEKHVASLMTKFSQPNRQAVITYATTMPHE